MKKNITMKKKVFLFFFIELFLKNCYCIFVCMLSTQRYINKNRVCYIYIQTMRSVVNSCFVAFVLPSSGLTLAIYYTLYGLCQMKPLDRRTYATKKQLIFGFTPPPMSLDIYSALYFIYVPYLCGRVSLIENRGGKRGRKRKDIN